MKSFDEVVAFHGHACGGLALGYKASELAAELLGLSFSGDEEVVCIAETDSCTIDAIQVLLGCTAGKGNLLVNCWGKTAFSFYNRQTGKSVRLVAKPKPGNTEMLALRPKILAGTASPEEEARYHALSHQAVEELLAASAEELFAVKETSLCVPDQARLYRNVVCAVCGEEVADGLAVQTDAGHVCVPCSRK
jgi:formylmethanofuran dehydrogenase subunit E